MNGHTTGGENEVSVLEVWSPLRTEEGSGCEMEVWDAKRGTGQADCTRSHISWAMGLSCITMILGVCKKFFMKAKQQTLIPSTAKDKEAEDKSA